MADVRFISADGIHSKFVQVVEVVTRICDFPWLEPKPPYGLQNALEVSAFFSLRVGIVVAKIAVAAVMRSIAEVHENGF